MTKIPTAQIAEVVTKIKTWNPARSKTNETICYIDISSIDQREKRIANVVEIDPKEAPSRARQLVCENDVLVSTVRPNLNAVAYVTKEFDGATASTGFCVLRPNTEILDGRYLFHWVKTPNFVLKMINLSTGASYPAINDKSVKTSKIPMPPLDEQKRIAVILDKADAIRRKRQQSIKLADEFLRATFLDMFGDPVVNPKGWKIGLLKDYVDMEVGFPFKSKDYKTYGIKLLRGANVLPSEIDWSDVVHWDQFDSTVQSKYLLIEDDVVLAMDRPWISKGLKVAQIKSNDLPSYLVQRVARLRGKRGLSSDYIYYSLLHPAFTQHCNPKKTETTVPHISPDDIRSYPIPIPSEDIAKMFSAYVQKIKRLKLRTETNNFESNALLQSLTQRAFRGEI